ncbi:hypothetical protein [Streptomyces sp. NPDC058398]|uniref:hypothetical protein n=1 Tax=Streptomyces sp. NPDC058398 TaxID=3346479 RepID=UPI0036554C83
MGRGTGGSGDAGGAVDEASALLTAVRAQDTDLVRSLLRDDVEPDLLDAAFCLAVRTYSAGIAQLLLDHGADPGRRGPDELLPLRRVVEFGSPALAEVLLHHRNLGRYTAPELLEMCELARHWQETGVETELVRLTGSSEAVGRTRVQDDLRRDRRPGLADAMAALLDDAERQVQIAAVHGLALHEDERCVPASHRLGPPRRGVLTEEHCLEAAWRYEWRREAGS